MITLVAALLYNKMTALMGIEAAMTGEATISFVRRHLIGMFHLGFAKIAHFLGDQSVAEAELRPPRLNHASSFSGLSAAVFGPFGAQQIMIELASSIAS